MCEPINWNNILNGDTNKSYENILKKLSGIYDFSFQK